MVLICGRYEGVDERVNHLLADDELSIGDYVLSGGELAAAVILDATARLLPGVLGHADSSRYESFGIGDDPTDTLTSDGVPRSTHGAGGLLDYPHYTRPAEFRGTPIPEVLAGGDHTAIRQWRRREALAKTLRNRPDLLDRAQLTPTDRKILAELANQTATSATNIELNISRRSNLHRTSHATSSIFSAGRPRLQPGIYAARKSRGFSPGSSPATKPSH